MIGRQTIQYSLGHEKNGTEDAEHSRLKARRGRHDPDGSVKVQGCSGAQDCMDPAPAARPGEDHYQRAARPNEKQDGRSIARGERRAGRKRDRLNDLVNHGGQRNQYGLWSGGATRPPNWLPAIIAISPSWEAFEAPSPFPSNPPAKGYRIQSDAPSPSFRGLRTTLECRRAACAARR